MICTIVTWLFKVTVRYCMLTFSVCYAKDAEEPAVDSSSTILPTQPQLPPAGGAGKLFGNLFVATRSKAVYHCNFVLRLFFTRPLPQVMSQFYR